MGNAQQLQQLLAANPASLNPVLQALANHARGASGESQTPRGTQ